MPILVDTGPLIALADRRDPYHEVISRFVFETSDVLLVPVTILPEADYMIAEAVGGYAAGAMIRSVADGELQLEPVLSSDLMRCVDLMHQYSDSDIGFVDASVVAVAERLRITRILTLDRRHFGMIRPTHCPAFELIP